MTFPDGFSETALDACFAAAGDGPLLVALSGGGDSAALLHLLADRAPGRLVVCVVDHAMRRDSERDAIEAALIADARGVDAEIVRITWNEPAPRRSQEELRHARYAALCACAKDVGAKAIALGHTLDDQIETVSMRAARQGRVTAGMRALAPAPLWPEGEGLMLTRPLLNVRRAALRDWLRARGGRWLEDPSNENEAFERVRFRTELAARERAGDLDVPALAQEAAAQAALEDAAKRRAAAWLAASARIEEGVAHVRLTPALEETRALGLAALLAAVAGAQWTGDRAKVLRLLEAAAQPGFAGASLGGCQISPAADGMLIGRDPGAVFGRQGAPPLAPLAIGRREAAAWDGRVEVTAVPTRCRIGPDPLGRDADQPYLLSTDKPVSLAEAADSGLVAIRWLIEVHISHILFTPP